MSAKVLIEVPQNIQRLTEIILRLNDRIQWLEQRTSNIAKPKTIIGRRGKNRYPIKSDSIAYCYTENRETWLLTVEGKEYLINYNLDQLEQLLDAATFYRANRKTICAKKAVEKFEILAKSRIKVMLNPVAEFEVIVSSEKSAAFKEWICC